MGKSLRGRRGRGTGMWAGGWDEKRWVGRKGKGNEKEE